MLFRICLSLILSGIVLLNANEIPRPTIVSLSATAPGTLVLQRHPCFAYARVQIVENCPTEAATTVVADTITTAEQIDLLSVLSSWLNPACTPQVRVAHAQNSHVTSTQNQSWTTKPWSLNLRTTAAPELRWPADSAKLIRAQNSVLNFVWKPLSQAVQYQVQLAQQTATGWKTVKTGTTTDSSWTISHADLSGGNWRWTVSAQDAQLGLGAARSRHFSLDEGRELRQFSWWRTSGDSAQPAGFSHIQITTADGYPAQSATSDAQGRTDFLVKAGTAEVSVNQAGFPTQNLTLQIPASGAVRCTLPSGNATIRGYVSDAQGLPWSHASVLAYNSISDTVWGQTQLAGDFKLILPAGQWQWQMHTANGVVLAQRAVSLAADQVADLGTMAVARQWCSVQFKVNATNGPVSAAQLKLYDAQRHIKQIFTGNDQGIIVANTDCEIWDYGIHAPQHHPIYGRINFRTSRDVSALLNRGQAQVSGTVHTWEEVVVDVKTKKIGSNATVWALPLSGEADSIATRVNAQGEYLLDLPHSGKWILYAQENGARAQPDTVEFNSPQQYAQRDLHINLQARIEGYLRGSGSAAEVLIVELWHNSTMLQQVNASYQSNNKWHYRFSNVPPGSYTVQARGSAQHSATPSAVEVSFVGGFTGKGTVVVPDMDLIAHQSFWSVQAWQKDFTWHKIPAQLQVHTPYIAQARAGDTIPLSPGEFNFSLLPDSLAWIALWEQNHIVNARQNKLDSVYFPAYHTPPKIAGPLTENSTITYSLDLFAEVDSAFMWVQDMTGQKQRLTAKSKAVHQIDFAYQPRNYEPRLDYWFEVYTPDWRFANPYPHRHFTQNLRYTSVPFNLHIGASDTIYMPTQLSHDFTLTARTSYGNLALDSAHSLSCSSNDSIVLEVELNGGRLQLTSREAGIAQINCDAKIGNHQSTLSHFVKIVPVSELQGEFSLSYSNRNNYTLAGDTIEIQAYIVDSNGIAWLAPLQYSLHPAGAVDSIYQNTIWLRQDFIGPLEVVAPYRQLTDTLIIPVGAALNGQQSYRFTHDSTLAVYADSGTWDDNLQHLVYLEKVSDLHRLRFQLDSLTLQTALYNLQASSANRNAPLYLEFNPSYYQEPALYLLDTVALTGQKITAATKSASPKAPVTLPKIAVQGEHPGGLTTVKREEINWLQVACNQPSPSFYTLAAANSIPLRAELTIIPNPFSPFVTALIDGNDAPGTSVRYVPYVEGQKSLQVQISVYNMAGEKVRTLLPLQTQNPELYQIAWLGDDDNGNLLRNGRYLVVMELKSPHKNKLLKKMVKAVVVFK